MKFLERREYGRDAHNKPYWEYRVICPACLTERWTRANRAQARKATGLCKSCWAQGKRKPRMSSHPLHRAWSAMRTRCYNKKTLGYRHYGGRGIRVCAQWLASFETFARDMGPKPSPKHSLDRINNDGNYEPGNCRWATSSEQNYNKRAGCAAPRRCTNCVCGRV